MAEAETASLAERLCRTGTAWGLLQGQSLGVLCAWWLARHVAYIALTVWVLQSFCGLVSRYAVGIFFLVVHGAKLGMFLRSEAREQQASKPKESSIAIAAPCVLVVEAAP